MNITANLNNIYLHADLCVTLCCGNIGDAMFWLEN
jgi:hypothetical protein